MTNHVHILAIPEHPHSLAATFRYAHSSFAQYANAEQCRSGISGTTAPIRVPWKIAQRGPFSPTSNSIPYQPVSSAPPAHSNGQALAFIWACDKTL